MKYILYILLIAVIFGLVALVDFVFGKLFPRLKAPKTAKAVRMPRYSFILGILIVVLGIMGLLFYTEADWFLRIGMVVAMAMGLYMTVNYIAFGIFYDEDGFTYRTLTKKAVAYRYGDITGQRSFLARSGLNISLLLGEQEIPLNGSMKGLSDFMNCAFFAWCRQTGRDPDEQDYDPTTLRYFPEA